MAGTAPIYSLATDDHVRAEAAAWARFSNARDTSEFCNSWLAVLCSQIERVGGALLVLGPDPAGAFTAAAVWPDPQRDMQYLSLAAQSALRERRGIVVAQDGTPVPARDQPVFIGYPIEVSGTLHGAVVLDLAAGPEQGLQRALRMLHWASAWLVDHFRQRQLRTYEVRLERTGTAADLIATAVQDRRFTPSALAVANELAARMNCDRVSVGLERDGSIEVKAISHTASFDPKTNLVRLICEAMDEVLDLDTAVVYPPRADDEIGAIAHAELARELKDAAILSVPLMQDGHACGVMTLERSQGEPFDAEAVELCRTAGMLLGPILVLKEENERGEWRRLREALGAGARALFGPRHPGVKLVALVAAVIVVFLSLASGEYRVGAKTVIEGAVQRALVAPFDGYIAQSAVRAGDNVKKGQVLAALDQKDLKLERTRLASEREQLLRKHRQALAAQDRAAMAVIAAQVSQTEAQLALIEDRLARATLVAPFDGVVVSGDLSQLLGTPVEQGKVLFQVAPLDAYRVILEVDERDIASVRVGQPGELALSGMPAHPMHLIVKQLTPVSTAQDGRNYFRVEAKLDDPSAHLRPGMEGVGKIETGRRRLIWIWTHSLVDWARLQVWKWLP
ncbi:MAG TPA: HlyD family efflux transporter periplasmic adaptor subunit [Burkholderiales bacterium]|nr:HlyD family efflux transporter periplasmic adaptor subunit [Burkholderiales bacterium]